VADYSIGKDISYSMNLKMAFWFKSYIVLIGKHKTGLAYVYLFCSEEETIEHVNYFYIVVFFTKGRKKASSFALMLLNTERDSSPKNENSVSIYSPSCCSNPLCVYLFC